MYTYLSTIIELFLIILTMIFKTVFTKMKTKKFWEEGIYHPPTFSLRMEVYRNDQMPKKNKAYNSVLWLMYARINITI